MNLALFSAALLMTVIAMGFVTTPLVVAHNRNDSGSAKFSLLAVVAVFALGIFLYGVIGKPQFSNVTPAPTATTTTAQLTQPNSNDGNDKVGSVTALLSGLETRLAENPDDAKGWLLLAKSYDHLGRDDDARAAYEKAKALGMTDATLESRLSGGTAQATSSEAAIHGQVSVADAVASQVNPDDVVYVVAKADGNPMPLAVLRRSAADLPFDFVLTDENSMVQGGGLSSADSVTVSALLSKTGDALDAGNIGATSAAIDPRASGELILRIGNNK
ncbi:MAG: hypothetical protein P8X98_11570 [Woeseiaceae bacterium]